jgi:hypothetical protein
MAQFTVPQFIEREPKIVGPFTFKQFIYIGAAGVILFLLYFTIPFAYFILAAIILLPFSLALAILKRGGIPLPTLLKNFFIQLISPKVYIWKKTPLVRKIQEEKKVEEITKEKVKELPLKIAEKSRLKKLITELETKIR